VSVRGVAVFLELRRERHGGDLNGSKIIRDAPCQEIPNDNSCTPEYRFVLSFLSHKPRVNRCLYAYTRVEVQEH